MSAYGWRILGWGTALIMLLIPFISMQFTDEVDWTVSDFIVFGAMLAAAGGAFEICYNRVLCCVVAYISLAV